MKRVQAAVFMQRRVRGHLSRVYLHIMHAVAGEHGVPFGALTDALEVVPDELLPIAAKLKEQLRTHTITLTGPQERLLRQRYVHHSANWDADVGEGLGVLEKAFFNIPQEGGRSVFDQSAPA